MTSIVLQVDQEKPYPARGKYLLIESATGPVTVTARLVDGTEETKTYRSRDGMRFDSEMESLQLLNSHTAVNTVIFHTTIGEYRPSGDGLKVVLTGSDVQIETVSADIGGLADAVAGSDAGNFSLIALFKRFLGKLPSSIGQKVKTNSLSVTLASDHDQVPVKFAAQDISMQVHTVPGNALNTPAAVTPTVGGGLIAANAAREEITLYAPTTNLLPVWVGSASGQGIPLEPGKFLPLKTTAAIQLFAGNGTDEVNYLEIA
jgi:hypothetical protein